MMTKEKLEERIVSLKAARDQHVANANMVNGHLTEAEYWLAELTKAPEVSEGDG